MFGNFDHQFLQKRLIELETYFNVLLKYQNIEKMPALKSFLLQGREHFSDQSKSSLTFEFLSNLVPVCVSIRNKEWRNWSPTVYQNLLTWPIITTFWIMKRRKRKKITFINLVFNLPSCWNMCPCPNTRPPIRNKISMRFWIPWWRWIHNSLI